MSDTDFIFSHQNPGLSCYLKHKPQASRRHEKIPVQVPAIETCFMSIDEIAQIFSKSQSPLYIGGEARNFFKSQEYEENMKKYEGNMKKYEENMKRYKGNMKKYEGNMKQYEEIMKKYEETMKKYEGFSIKTGTVLVFAHGSTELSHC